MRLYVPNESRIELGNIRSDKSLEQYADAVWLLREPWSHPKPSYLGWPIRRVETVEAGTANVSKLTRKKT